MFDARRVSASEGDNMSSGGVTEEILEPALPIVDPHHHLWFVIWNAFKRTVAGASPAEKAALFSGSAQRVYRLEV